MRPIRAYRERFDAGRRYHAGTEEGCPASPAADLVDRLVEGDARDVAIHVFHTGPEAQAFIDGLEAARTPEPPVILSERVEGAFAVVFWTSLRATPSTALGPHEARQPVVSDGRFSSPARADLDPIVHSAYRYVATPGRYRDALETFLKARGFELDDAGGRLWRVVDPVRGETVDEDEEFDALYHRWHDRNEILDEAGAVWASPARCGGRPVVQGSRLTVSQIVAMIDGGETFEGLARNWDHVPKERFEAAYAWGKGALGEEGSQGDEE